MEKVFCFLFFCFLVFEIKGAEETQHQLSNILNNLRQIEADKQLTSFVDRNQQDKEVEKEANNGVELTQGMMRRIGGEKERERKRDRKQQQREAIATYRKKQRMEKEGARSDPASVSQLEKLRLLRQRRGERSLKHHDNSTKTLFAPNSYERFRENELLVCTKGSWMEEYTQLHNSILDGKSPPKFLVTSCGAHLTHEVHHPCSGWGNQLELLEALLIAAMATKRALLIGGYEVSWVPNLVVSPAINWSFRDAVQKHPQMMNMTWHHVQLLQTLNNCSFNDLEKLTRNEDVLYLAEKEPTGISRRMSELANYIAESTETNITEYFHFWGENISILRQRGCFIRYLVHPGPLLQDAMSTLGVPKFLENNPTSMNIRFGDMSFASLHSHDERLSAGKGVRVVDNVLQIQSIVCCFCCCCFCCFFCCWCSVAIIIHIL